MYIEERLNDSNVYLVNEISHIHQDACCWIDFPQDGSKEYGNGSKLFFFEGMGTVYQPFALDLIHANSKEDAEILIQERYGDRFQNKTLIRKHKEVIEVIDAR